MRHLIILLLALAFVGEGLQTLPYAQTDQIPTALLLERENSDQPSEQTIYLMTMDGERVILLAPETGHQFNAMENGWLLLDDGSLGFNLRDESPVLTTITPEPPINHLAAIRAAAGEDFTPLFGPVLVDEGVYLMAGENDPAVNLYALQNGDLMQLTDARMIFPEAVEPLLSASVEFIAPRPDHDGFLYRARVRDAEGTDHNALFYHDLTGSVPTPFFGKDPVWSPDGLQLAGSRVRTLDDGSPRYGLWVVDVASGDVTFVADGCNPGWSPDGAWLAYDLHENATWQGYTDCYASGQVEALNLVTCERILLSDGLQDFVTLIGWLPE